MECAALVFAELDPFVVAVEPTAWAVPNDALAVLVSLFRHIVAQPMCNLLMSVAYASYWHELRRVFVTKSAADAYRPLNALEHEWNIVIHGPLKRVFVLLSPEHLVNVAVNVWLTHWPVNWPEYLQSMCFYAQQINVEATMAVDDAEAWIDVDVGLANADVPVVADADAITKRVTEFAPVELLKLVFSVDTIAVEQLHWPASLCHQHIYAMDDSIESLHCSE